MLYKFCVYLWLQELPSTALTRKISPTHRDINVRTFSRENSLVHKEVWLKVLP